MFSVCTYFITFVRGRSEKWDNHMGCVSYKLVIGFTDARFTSVSLSTGDVHAVTPAVFYTLSNGQYSNEAISRCSTSVLRHGKNSLFSPRPISPSCTSPPYSHPVLPFARCCIFDHFAILCPVIALLFYDLWMAPVGLRQDESGYPGR